MELLNHYQKNEIDDIMSDMYTFKAIMHRNEIAATVDNIDSNV